MRLDKLHNFSGIKQGDTKRKFQLQALDDNESPLSLSGYSSVKVVIGNDKGKILEITPTLESETGVFSFSFSENDFTGNGEMQLELHLKDSGGKLSILPERGYYKFKIEKSIDTIQGTVSSYTLTYFLGEVEKKKNQLQSIADQAVQTANTADGKANSAVETANNAETTANSVQEQFNQVVIDGDSSVEAAQARVKADGTSFSTLKNRLDTSDELLAETVNSVGESIEGFTSLKNAADTVGSNKKDIVISKPITINENTTIPENVTLKFTREGLITVPTGLTLTINGYIQAGIHQIFDAQGTIDGLPKIWKLYPEWFGAMSSSSSAPVDVTTQFNMALNTAQKWGYKTVRMIENRGHTLKAYHVKTLFIRAEVMLEGLTRDRSAIRQLTGETGPVITDDPLTGAKAIRLERFRIDKNNNQGDGIVLGFNPAFVWGVEGRIESVYVENCPNGIAFKVKSSVTSMNDVIAINSKIGFHFEGGSCSVGSIIGDECDTFIQFKGSSNKIAHAHYEGLSSSVIKFLLDSKENVIGHLSILMGTNPYTDVILFETTTQRNGIQHLNLQNFSTASFTNVVNDLTSNYRTTQNITTYVQGKTLPLQNVTDTELGTYGSFNVNGQTGEIIYVFTGTRADCYFVIPQPVTAGLKITIINKSANPIKAQNVTGGTVFYGVDTFVSIPSKSSKTFISDGQHWLY
ncbi:hypothetical protein HF072_07485 [Bacillus sp. RO3]|nr:hypothetical protein [Bacillus sp. RO3]